MGKKKESRHSGTHVNPNTWETEAGQGFEARLVYMESSNTA